ncbi:glycosyltransferase [Flexivirga alba]|uniref:Glycosyltransferase n=1 Tax=Flexivirga alba TaxID=702742 RepID=A0ABW2ACH9_9MICO
MAFVQPKFSVVVPLYRTARYLPDLLESFDRQQVGSYTVEFIFVDDGSDDDSAAIAATWLNAAEFDGCVIQQQNAGVSAARNRGLDAATGDWVTFPDSDDFVSDGYFCSAAKALEQLDDGVVLLSGNVQRFTESTGKKSDEHPLRFKFREGTGAVDLARRPTFIQTQSASAFFRMDVIREHGVRFVEGLRVAEDAVFASTYLLAAPTTRIAPLTESVYYYRRREAGTRPRTPIARTRISTLADSKGAISHCSRGSRRPNCRRSGCRTSSSTTSGGSSRVS